MSYKAPAGGGGRRANAADPDALLAVFVGANWESHYRRSFAALRGSRSPLRGSWNWAAALAPFWLASRGLWLLQVFLPLLWIMLVRAFEAAGLPFAPSGLLAFLLVVAAEGYWSDRWLLDAAERAIRGVGAEAIGDPKALKRIARQGGMSVLRALVIPVFAGVPFWVFGNAYVATYSNFPLQTPEYGSPAAEAKHVLVTRVPVVQPERGTAPLRVREAWIERDRRVRTAFLLFRRVERFDRWFLAVGGARDALDPLMSPSRVEPRINGTETRWSCGSSEGCVLWIEVSPPFPDTAHLSFCERPSRSSRSVDTSTSAWPPCSAEQPER